MVVDLRCAAFQRHENASKRSRPSDANIIAAFPILSSSYHYPRDEGIGRKLFPKNKINDPNVAAVPSVVGRGVKMNKFEIIIFNFATVI